MRVPRAAINAFSRDLDALARAAHGFVANRIASAVVDMGEASVADVVAAAREAISDAIVEHGDMAAGAAADYFDEFMDVLGIDARAAIYETIDMEDVMSRVWPMAQDYVATKMEDSWDGFADDAGDLAGYLTKRNGIENVMRNCDENGVRYARVPTGAETCGFCFMLASRGFVYHSEQDAGEGHAFHRHCDCKIVPGLPDTQVEGYDPDALYGRWLTAKQAAKSGDFVKIIKVAESWGPEWMWNGVMPEGD